MVVTGNQTKSKMKRQNVMRVKTETYVTKYLHTNESSEQGYLVCSINVLQYHQ